MHRGRGLLICEDIHDFLISSGKLKAIGYEVVLRETFEKGACRLKLQDFDFVVVHQGDAEFEGESIMERAMNLPRPIPVLMVDRSVNIHDYLVPMELGAVEQHERPKFERFTWTLGRRN